jgi:hypothetical protein
MKCTSNEKILKEIRDNFAIETERFKLIMTSNQDVMNEIAKLVAGHTQLHTTILTAIADMGTGGDAARAAIVTALQAAQTEVAKTEAELTAAIAAATSPPAAPVTLGPSAA